MRVVAVIPARYASTRFPGKPLIDIRGKSMIRRVYEGVKTVPDLAQVLVATDDARIFGHVRSFGGEAVMTSRHHGSGTERCAEAVSLLGTSPDIVINVQGDEPFIAAAHLSAVLSCFDRPGTQIASLVKKITDLQTLRSPHIPKVVFDEQLRALYFSRSPIPYLRDTPQESWLEQHVFYKHIGMYAYRAPVLAQLAQLSPGRLEHAEKLEQLRWMEHGYAIQLALTEHENVAIDTPEDLERVLAGL
ncbi:3-deoxy-manno-octulosonate cytidylyltransferase [Compostibacter hankyongensis]|uniref:3-deoxy-manno-octulosonate cytidylyltransferase n=1 Tax=Compostibacter hankyongensis TaxID=1007089 RepID=A0ABP8G818_9BACT